MTHAMPITHNHVLQAAVETCEGAWAALWRSLEDGTHVTIQRALIAEYIEADDTVKRLMHGLGIKEKEDGESGAARRTNTTTPSP